MSENKKFKIGITIGDINGVGIEVILKTLSDERILNHCIPIIYGSARAINYHKKALNIETFNFNIINNIDRPFPKAINVINCWQEEVSINFGELNDDAGKYSLMAIDACAEDLKNGKIDAMVTAPVNKNNIKKINPSFTGQTEFLAQKANCQTNLMLLISNNMKVGLATNHISIKEIPDILSLDIIFHKLEILKRTLQRDFLIPKPKIAVLGLNPHAGDGGAIGTEELEIIQPAIEHARSKNILAFGPYAADGFFGSQNYEKFDAILAMYHDQGLVAFKSLSFGCGVNYTAGMPFVRTSPDHGTAFDIAGQNKASEESFRNALFAAMDIIKNRNEFDDMNKNPLMKTELSREIN